MSAPGHEEKGSRPSAAADEKTDPARLAASPGLGESDSDSIYDPEKKISEPVKKSTTHSTAYFENSEQKDTTSKSDLEGQRRWYEKLNPLKWGSRPPVPEERSVSREYNASLFSIITFQWMAPLMRVGYMRPLELNDIWLVNPNRTVEAMSGKLQTSFQKRVARGDKYPLLWAMHETFKFEFWIGGVCRLCADIFQVFSPFALRYLIQFSTEAYYASRNPHGTPGPHVGKGLGLAFGITVMQALQSLGTNQFIYRGMMVGGQSRAALIAAIFEKSMKISGRAKAGGNDAEMESGNKSAHKEGKKDAPEKRLDKDADAQNDGTGWGNGRVVNLMGTDTYRIDQASGLFHLIWTSPISILITLTLLLVNLTYSALAGFALLVIGAPILTKAVRSLFVRRSAINKVTDQRVSLTQEILQGVRFVKYFGWERSFLKRLGDIRKKEIRAIQVLLAIRMAINAVSMSLPIFASMLSFITFSLSKHVLDPAPIFSSLALFNALRMPLMLLPMVIGQVIDAWSSVGRIQEYLMAEEIKEEFIWDYEGKNAVEAKEASFTWERATTPDATDAKGTKKQRKVAKKGEKRAGKAAKTTNADRPGSIRSDCAGSSATLTDPEPFKLNDLSFSAGRNELIAVIGRVGSGKSSLLAALAGDMRMTEGGVTMGASRAFCPQYAWIQNATVKDNVLFGKEYDAEWYSKVIEACALQPDLEMLPHGDLTEIGERGITVSGGQKQRLNIARAIYFGADIVLLDDPLSAVDAHVGRHIFDNAICGLLKDKCRILATHQLHVLSRCDRIIWLEDGKIEAIDTFENLITHNEGFSNMMATISQEEKKKKEEGKDDKDGIEEETKDPKKLKKKRGAALMQAEERAVESVPWSVYGAYISASGSTLNAPLVIWLLILSQCANIATSLWLSWWTSDKWNLSMGKYIGTYVALGVIQALLMFLYSIVLAVAGTTASKVMLHRAMRRTLRAPMSFFDTTPLGRITNRFSKDTDIMDNNLTDAMRMYLLTLAMIVAVFILIIVYFHFVRRWYSLIQAGRVANHVQFAVALGPLFLMFVFSASYYRASAREVKRHEAVLRSVVFSRFGEALSGTACIRAYGLQGRFIQDLRDAIDSMDSAYFLTYGNQRWLSVRLDAIGNLLVMTTGILVVTSRFNVSPSTAGLVLSYILSIVQLIQFTVRQLAEVENAMNSTERLHYYGTHLEEEAPLHIGEVRPSWPEHGEIVFDNVQMRYRGGLPLVLQGIDLHIRGGERIGIVGRTGAGKSSIMTTLFRLVELSDGSITIDGIDISSIGLHDLRSRLAIIPQDPTLFRGTIRSNLDPFGEHSDLQLWSALRQSYLVTEEAGLDDKSPGRIHLDGVVEEEGLNFSLGQRQLMALARALVRDSRVIICDEATSSVDMETDQKIQRTIATGFKGKTLLCIAHRLRTIINYDRICVMDSGRIVELDSPLKLYDKPGGTFRGMCEQSGIKRENFFDESGISAVE
ncbi:hypothetical protein FGG08_003344 [Glutinoglossum americanum]|uniref:Uncharacterized protein n=1 Tax=Glutinoglossum americanum TaxID=1670608 RepID=A0A9P8L3L6_9PEZI|nr:hypothetical protein FGG08_003344 [Glutinoglossum americanum]